MWLYIVGSLPLIPFLLYIGMKNNIFTFGISGLKQKREHKEKEWKTEKAVVPVSKFKVKTDVKWCPKTDEIFYRTPKNTNMFEKDWKEVSQYSDLYDRLLQNFKQKYRQTNQRKNQRTQWTKASKRQTNI